MDECKIDSYGFPFYDKMPDGYRVAIIDDFHFHGRKRIGMEYLMTRVTDNKIEIHRVTENLSAGDLMPFINDNRVFVKI
jgi:hypothetical protein